MSSTLHSAAAVPAALSAFLRGTERRAAVFAELQCGDRATAEMALAATMRAFRNHAAAVPMADWPQRFWALLVATPGLRQSGPDEKSWPAGLEALATLDPAHRQALLLRLAAGLEEDAAAAVAGVDAESYRAAIAEACPRDVHGDPDAVAWRALAEAVQQQVRSLPPDRLVRLARLREAAIEGARLPPRTADERSGHAATPSRWNPRRHWRWLAMAVVVAVSGLALMATWHSPRTPGVEDTGSPWADPRIEVEVLPESAPAARMSDAQALLLHPDMELLRDPEEPALTEEAAFLAWYSASTEVRPEAIAEPADALEVGITEEPASAPR